MQRQQPKTFSNSAAPAGYVPGAGRGAVGFTTRSDIGSASVRPPEVTFGAPPPGYVAGRGYSGFGVAGGGAAVPQAGALPGAGRGRGAGPAGAGAGAGSGAAAPVRADYSESMWDATMGYGGERLFAHDAYDADDAEADRVYDAIDNHMEGRHKRRREREELMLQQQQQKLGIAPVAKQAKITERFSDLKRDLATVTSAEWDAIPEVGDHSLKLTQKREKESFAPIPDSLLLATLSGAGVTNGNMVGYATSIDPNAAGSVHGLGERLDRMGDSVTGQTVVDPKGYLTSLSSVRVSSDAEVGDIKKARLLLHSVTTTNPKHAPGWVAAALVEEVAGRMVAARKIIMQGCEACPDAEDLWIEAVRLHTRDNAKTILAQAVKHLPTSVKLWLKAAELEESEQAKKVVLRRALEMVPNSVILWKTAIQMESLSDAKIMLARAVECVPQSVEMWLALARLETHENARKVLNQARAALPTEPSPWITAAKLEEAHGNFKSVPQIVRSMLTSLAQYQVVIARETWLQEARAAEYAGAIKTSEALVQNTIGLGVDEEDRLETFLDDASSCVSSVGTDKAPHTARAIYIHALGLPGLGNKKTLWLARAVFEKSHGTVETLEETLRAAVQHCPHEEVLWLMSAKEKWLAGDLAAARDILKLAFDANPGSQQIWLAAAKLEWENGEVVRARALLTKARQALSSSSSSERVWLKSALLEREQGDATATLALLDQALERFPAFAKFYMMAGQASDSSTVGIEVPGNGASEQSAGEGGPAAPYPPHTAKAKGYYQRGLKACPESVPLWLLLSRLEERVRGPNKARPVLEMARLRLPSSDVLWLESVRLERRAGQDKTAETVMAQALQQCPASGILWAEDVLTCPKPAQKTKSVDALKRCDNDPHVFAAVARLFAAERKFPKARKWFERAVALAPKLGDAWAHFYVFEICCAGADKDKGKDDGEGATAAEAEDVLKRCVAADPNRGELWCATAKRPELARQGPARVLRVLASDLLK